nr:reverse transcriptase domain-containing protein [Tanacetum cinerariifolium]
FYCFLDGFSGYFQIPIDPRDQEKTTFTCLYGTVAYRRMPFGLCNAPGTFQTCMLAIFHDMVENTMEVFMDDFSVFGNSFENCLSRLGKCFKGGFTVVENEENELIPTRLVTEWREADAFLGLEDDPDSSEFDPFYYDPKGDILLLEAILNKLKACEAKTIKFSVDEPLEVELKDLPPHLEYAFLEGDNKLPVVIAKELGDEEKSALIKVLKSHK